MESSSSLILTCSMLLRDPNRVRAEVSSCSASERNKTATFLKPESLEKVRISESLADSVPPPSSRVTGILMNLT